METVQAIWRDFIDAHSIFASRSNTMQHKRALDPAVIVKAVNEAHPDLKDGRLRYENDTVVHFTATRGGMARCVTIYAAMALWWANGPVATAIIQELRK